MQLFSKRVLCLLDSGCELTLVPRSLVSGATGIEVTESSQRVWAANGIELAIDGEVELPFQLPGRCIPTRALVSADIEEVMLGIDWLQAHKCLWDFASGRLNVDGHEAVTMSRKGPFMCRRVYVQEDVQVPPRQQTDVPARSTLLSLDPVADSCILDSHQVQPAVYVGCTLLPRSHHDLKVRMINTTSEPLLLTKDTCLGNLCPVQVLDDMSKQTETVEQSQVNVCSSEAPGQPVVDAGQAKSDDVRASLMSKLPAELTDAERQQVEQLLSDHDDILSRYSS